MASDLQALSGYKVGEISQALFTNQESKTYLKKNVELSALFSSTNPSQPAFVAVPLKVRLRNKLILNRTMHVLVKLYINLCAFFSIHGVVVIVRNRSL